MTMNMGYFISRFVGHSLTPGVKCWPQS